MEEGPQDVTVQEGESATFLCRFSRLTPDTTFAWYHEDRPISHGDIYQIEIDLNDGYSRLCLSEAFPEDAGKYAARATNLGGSYDEASAILTVIGECVQWTNHLYTAGTS